MGVVGAGKVISDRPLPGEFPLPAELVAAKRRLLPDELERYRVLGRDAAEAMTEVLKAGSRRSGPSGSWPGLAPKRSGGAASSRP